ncbi:MAG: hypothetical protein ACYTX0_40825 [Nostoc sp.]
MFCAIAVGRWWGWGAIAVDYQKLIYMKDKPKKKTQLFKDGQVEGYEVGLTMTKKPKSHQQNSVRGGSLKSNY